MKIKKLEMIGFKSFVDRTVVHFDHDVLGIVGPNGCGKSNIVDAIRWCMGEQSARHLRGRAMEDVIFNGSETRTAHDFAEVTLTFENNDSTGIPVEYRDYPEIAVSRRLFRNGDSEYLINKTQVRLKDVTDLFLGTGVGTKAYSIIEQGKVGLIVSAKAEDRRLLIEEAAGITKFKSKKKQAERKMELTQQNLLRVGDIVAEIERNLGSLKRQAAKAERYLSYRNELEDLQLHEASHRYLELAGWITLETNEVEQATLKVDETRTAVVRSEAELETLRLEALTAEDSLDQATNENFARENDVRTEESAIARAKDRLESLRARELQAVTEVHDIEHQEEQLATEHASVQSEVSGFEAEEQAFDSELRAEEEGLAEVVTEQNRADADVADIRNVASTEKAAIASAEATLGGFERRQNELLVRRDRLRVERDDLEGERAEVEARVAELRRGIDELRSGRHLSAEEKARLETRLTTLKATIFDQERALEDAKNEFSKMRSRLHALQELHARLEGVGAGVKTLVGKGDACVLGLVADRVEAPHKYTHALAGLLGSRLQDVVVSDMDHGRELLASLATERKGRATIISHTPRYVAGSLLPTSFGEAQKDTGFIARLADVVRYSIEDTSLVRSLIGDAIVVRDIEAACRLTHAANAPAVTLDGTVAYPDGRVSGGQGEDVAAGLLDTKREERELSDTVIRLERHASECLAAHQKSRAEIAETGTALDLARQQAHSDEIALVSAEKDLERGDHQLEQIARRLEVILGEEQNLATATDESARERQQAQEQLEGANARALEAATHLAAAENEASSWRVQVDFRKQLVTERKVRVAGVREKLGACRGTLMRLSRSLEELVVRRHRLTDELVTNAVSFGETAAHLVEHRASLHGALDAAHHAQDDLARARGIFDEFRNQLNDREALLKDLRTNAEDAREQLVHHEMIHREKMLELEHLLSSVADRFRGLRLLRVVGDYHMRPPPDDELRGRISELLNLIERMGSVNLDAMKEHEEAEKRYTFYSEQKADLERALADLERAIQQMNRESKRLFIETFEAVKAKFEEVFPRMFRGGRASLRLTNPDDMLETGIDILAQPPGKKLSSIELMSGGEKALTAVSLIFAIFQIKPSPFCILDEVDAPLDEANVARYNDLVRSMTDRSQFILITHIKRTMQMVDVLYGVTMGEAGVSKIVSVKLAQSDQAALPQAAQVA